MKFLPSKSGQPTKSDTKPIRSRRKIFQVNMNVQVRNGNGLKSDVNVRLEGAAPPLPVGTLQFNRKRKSQGDPPGQMRDSQNFQE